MSSTTPLFIGVSGNDTHLKAHIQDCFENHVSIKNRQLAYWGIWFTTDDQSATAKLWRRQKVYPFKVDSYKEIPKIIFKICQEASKIE